MLVSRKDGLQRNGRRKKEKKGEEKKKGGPETSKSRYTGDNFLELD